MKKIIFIFTVYVMSFGFINANSCYQLRSQSAIQACLGNAYSTESQDARNIILGHCYSLSDRANNNGLRDVCIRAKNGCYSLTNRDAVYPCTSCDGSNQWARVYATGNVMTCYKTRSSSSSSSSSPRSNHSTSSNNTSLSSKNVNWRGVVKGLDPNGDGFLAIRKHPKGKQIGRLYNGDKVKIVKKKGSWYKVKDIRSGTVGWSHSKWIRVSKKHSSSKNGIVKGLYSNGDGFLAIRKSPKGKQIGKLYNGSKVRILSRSGKWLKIKDKSSGLVGWSHANWIYER